MQNGDLTSVELVKESLAQIQRHNKQGLNLKAVIFVAPEQLLLERAAVLDEERAQGKLRGPLHGIPVLLKARSIRFVDDVNRSDAWHRM